MKQEPLHPGSLIDYHDLFAEKNADIDILDDFFFNLITLIEDETNSYLTQNIQEIIQEMEFSSTEEANLFIGKYIEFTNSIVSFIEKIETGPDNDESDEDTTELFFTFLELYNDNLDTVADIIISSGQEVLHVVSEKYDLFSIEENLKIEEIAQFIDDKLGENYSYLVLGVMGLLDRLMTGEIKKTDDEYSTSVALLFQLIIILTANMNILRKKELSEKNTLKNKYKDVGRNEPCPCGSGKKFKKCCMLKTQ